MGVGMENTTTGRQTEVYRLRAGFKDVVLKKFCGERILQKDAFKPSAMH